MIGERECLTGQPMTQARGILDIRRARGNAARWVPSASRLREQPRQPWHLRLAATRTLGDETGTRSVAPRPPSPLAGEGRGEGSPTDLSTATRRALRGWR